MAAVQLERVRKTYGGRHIAVADATFEVADSEFVVLVGPSGCGKSTLLRIIAGLESPTSGTVRIGGRIVNDVAPKDRDIAMVFQSYALYPHMTVAENIGYPLRVRRQNPAEISAEVERIGARLGLTNLLANRPRQLSGGERQRVALARAIIRRPQAFLMDEPLSNLDARLRVEMRAELKHLQHELRTITIYVTHDQAEAMTLAHRIAVMCDGKIHQYDTPANVYHRPANTFVAQFVGSPSMNLIRNRDAILGIRPEDVELTLDEKPDWSPARIYVTEEMGNETIVILSDGSAQLTARTAAGFRADFDTPVWFRFRAEKLHRFDLSTGARLVD